MTRPCRINSSRNSNIHHQQGAALIVMMVIMVLGATTLLVSSINSQALRIERDKTTSDALAQARDALIGRSISDAKRPGSLPCPDTTDDGQSDSCSSSAFIGRLPWKTLGLPDLRDGYGERLWYALSPNFRSTISSINSDTPAQLSVSGTGEIIAVVFAPGSPLSSQQRGTDTIICPTDGQSHLASQCASNYLEGDNQNNDFVFEATVESASSNDHLLPISAGQLLPRIEKLIAKEVLDCLTDYADSNIYGRYPWSTQLDPTQNPNYDDMDLIRFGRLPDTMGNTKLSTNTMADSWPGTSAACNNIFTSNGWWTTTNWRELIFYSVASKYRPKDSAITSPCTTTCLGVDPPSTVKDKKVVVILAGKKLAGQNRSSKADKADPANYLEGSNATAVSTASWIFEQSPISNSFNDTVMYK